ncbi:hypothetical protein KCP75_16740 [Salmonella enterica subsp. enterica]|nr:hypothetical protein KCP75_16740 [Salmonella enterica subsp. enterica]
MRFRPPGRVLFMVRTATLRCRLSGHGAAGRDIIAAGFALIAFGRDRVIHRDIAVRAIKDPVGGRADMCVDRGSLRCVWWRANTGKVCIGRRSSRTGTRTSLKSPYQWWWSYQSAAAPWRPFYRCL